MPGRTKIRGGSCNAESEMGPNYEVKIHYDDDSKYFEVIVLNADGSRGTYLWGELKKDASVEMRWSKATTDLEDPSASSQITVT